MKKLISIVCLFVFAVSLCACGASTPAETTAAPTTTTAVPTETTSPYPVADKVIALTFDDGPNAHMDAILDVFAEYGGKATFFVIGKKIEGNNADFVKRAFDEGHEIGSHSYSHEDMTIKTEAEILSEISRTQAVVKEVTGNEQIGRAHV